MHRHKTFIHLPSLMEPEIGFGQDAWVSGIDTGTYPRARTFLFGVNIKF